MPFYSGLIANRPFTFALTLLRRKSYYRDNNIIMRISSHKMFVWKDIIDNNTEQKVLQIIFDVNNQKRRIFMKRPYNEGFASTVNRLRTKLQKKKIDTPSELVIHFCDTNGNPVVVSDEVTNYDSFYTLGHNLIKVDSLIYTIIRDASWLEKLTIGILPLIGCPILPSCDWRSLSTETKISYHWFISDKKHSVEIIDDPQEGFLGLKNWEQVATSPYFCPTEKCLGKYLAVAVVYGEGFTQATYCDTPVQKVDDELIFEERQKKYCSKKLDADRYRIVSYNLLADLYLNLKQNQTELFFPFCPKQYQSPTYRYPLLLREIDGYNADLLFLQEVDFRMQKRFLTPFFREKGYNTQFLCKGNEVNEGLMIAFLSTRFRLIEDYSVKLSDLLNVEKYSENADIVRFLPDTPADQSTLTLEKPQPNKSSVAQVLRTRPSVLQLLHLKTTDDVDIIAANTHLFFDPSFEEVKILQTALSLRHINRTVDKLNLNDAVVIFAGDLNCTPESEALTLIQGGSVNLVDRNNQENIISLTNPSAYTCLTGFPKYTNYTAVEPGSSGCPDTYKGFEGTLDYIWTRSVNRTHLEAIFRLPPPKHELVTKYGALPSKICASDHLALVCEVDITPICASAANC